ncbi:MAG: CvpA family protein [Erysipelothrix sp.]|nr:CvpA family protein [Erysipelothrix sp.]
MFTFPMDYIMIINAVLILFFIMVLYKGYKEGMLLQLVNLISTFVAVIIAWLFSDVFASIWQFVSYSKSGMVSIDKYISMHINQLIWFFILFVVIRIFLIILKPIASMISKMPLIKQVNSVLGGLFSVVAYIVYLLLITYFLSLPVLTNGKEVIDASFLKTVNQVSAPVLKILDTTIQENESIQFLLTEKKLSVTQKQSLVNLLAKNGFTNDEIREFLTKYE